MTNIEKLENEIATIKSYNKTMTNIEKLENEIATIKSKILILEAKLKNEA